MRGTPITEATQLDLKIALACDVIEEYYKLANQQASFSHVTATSAILGILTEIPDALDVVQNSQSYEETVIPLATFSIISHNTSRI